MPQRVWPVHPHPFPDELLSSWMIRLAQANGFKLHTFCVAYFGRQREIWTRDIDHLAPAWLLDELSIRTGVPIERVQESTLRSYSSYVFEHLNERGATRWILPLGVYHRTHQAYGQQFCPKCLLLDESPYLRRSWRLSLSAVCLQHNVWLRDRCGCCGRPLAPNRADTSRSKLRRLGVTAMAQCAYCDATLSTPVETSSLEDSRLQAQISDATAAGYAMVGNSPVYAHLYFDGLRMLMAGINKIRSDGHSLDFERASARERLVLLRDAVNLATDWPVKFLAACASIRRPYTVFAGSGRKRAPWWMSCILRRSLLHKYAALSLGEAEAIATAAQKRVGSRTVTAARALSGRDVRSFLRAPRLASEVVRRILRTLNQRIREASGHRRLILIRDLVMLLVARRLHLNLDQVVHIRVADVSDRQISGADTVLRRGSIGA